MQEKKLFIHGDIDRGEWGMGNGKWEMGIGDWDKRKHSVKKMYRQPNI